MRHRYIYNMALLVLIQMLAYFLFCSCKSNMMGPPFPKKLAREYLEAKGENTPLINNVVEMNEMRHDEFDELSNAPDINVRFLIALNPHTPHDILKRLAFDSNGFVRQGVAKNISIDREIIDMLIHDKYILVPSELVKNPSVPEVVILKLYENKRILLFNYAMNPKCPEKIKNDIRKSGDRLANKWLDINDKWNEENKAREQSQAISAGGAYSGR